MEITFEKFAEYENKDVLMMLENKEEMEGKVLGYRNDEKGELRFILLQMNRELVPVEVGTIKYIMATPL